MRPFNPPDARRRFGRRRCPHRPSVAAGAGPALAGERPRERELGVVADGVCDCGARVVGFAKQACGLVGADPGQIGQRGGADDGLEAHARRRAATWRPLGRGSRRSGSVDEQVGAGGEIGLTREPLGVHDDDAVVASVKVAVEHHPAAVGGDVGVVVEVERARGEGELGLAGAVGVKMTKMVVAPDPQAVDYLDGKRPAPVASGHWALRGATFQEKLGLALKMARASGPIYSRSPAASRASHAKAPSCRKADAPVIPAGAPAFS